MNNAYVSYTLFKEMGEISEMSFSLLQSSKWI